MKYGVKIFNYLKGMYEVAIFNTKITAEKCFEMMQIIESTTDLDEEELSVLSQYALSESIGYEDYWSCKNYNIGLDTKKINNFTYYINNKGNVSKETNNITFVFDGKYVEVPA